MQEMNKRFSFKMGDKENPQSLHSGCTLSEASETSKAGQDVPFLVAMMQW